MKEFFKWSWLESCDVGEAFRIGFWREVVGRWDLRGVGRWI